MSGYTEVIQVIGAMIIFSLVLMSTNRYILMNTQRQIESEVEMMAVSIAQDLIDDARLRAFDATTQNGGEPNLIPEGFTPPPFAQSTAVDRSQINTFEGFNGYTEIIANNLGTFNISCEVHYMQTNNLDEVSNVQTNHKRIRITVVSASLRSPVVVSFVRTYS